MNFSTRKLLAIALLLCAQPVVGDTLPSRSCIVRPAPQWNCGEWIIGAHALYFTPITCAYAYANVGGTAPGTNTTTGRAQLIPCRADWGFRVTGNYLYDCLFAGVSYQRFEATTARAIVSAATLITPGGLLTGPGKARGRVGIEYQNVDVRVGKYLRQECGSAFYLYGNARWVDLSYRRSARAAFVGGGIVNTQEKSQFSGGALGFGVGGELAIWCDFGAFADGNVLGVIGNRSLQNVEFKGINPGFTPQIRRAQYPSETCVIPEANFRIGINYAYACGCWTVAGEVGYELDYFWNGSMFPGLTGVDIGLGGTREFVPFCEDLGFSGLFFGARLIF